MDNHRLLTWKAGRVFVDFSSKGCGSGCRYCYIQDPVAAATYLGEAEFAQLVDELVDNPNFVPGRLGTLVSISPGTEPLKTAKSQDYLAALLERLLPFGNPVQLPTKEVVPDWLAALARESVQYAGQLVLFLSLATATRASYLEPGAAPVMDRLKNAELVRGTGIRSCAYIKPFLQSAYGEIDEFAELINETVPDFLCVGMRYHAERSLAARNPAIRRAASIPLAGTPHPAKGGFVATGVTRELNLFADALARLCSPIPVFLTSTCVSGFAADREPPLPVWQSMPSLCVRCRSCGTT